MCSLQVEKFYCKKVEPLLYSVHKKKYVEEIRNKIKVAAQGTLA